MKPEIRREVNIGEMERCGRGMLGCQIGKQLQSRQWRDYKSYISNSCKLCYSPRGRPLDTRDGDEKCRKAQKRVAHVVSGCSALVRTLNLTRHNTALKILFFEMLKGYQLADAIPPWYSPVQPKTVYQNDKVTAYRDVPVFTELCK